MRVFFKDPKKIRKGKRWSLLTYLDYLCHSRAPFQNWDLSNTYIMTLDGDVQFKYEDLLKLQDRLDVDSSLGGVCGRIIPIGSPSSLNPIVWFQDYEYALGHWLQKSCEMMFGSVLCLPGCFSMFRMCCLERVKDQFAKVAETGSESLKLDMGEDRFLCTLLIASGSTLAYVSSAIAKTFCPEDFSEFINQRRRWIASTFANAIDLIARRNEICINSNSIGWPFIVLQACFLLSSALSPAIVVLLISSGVGTLLSESGSLTFLFIFVAVQVLYTWMLTSRSFKKDTKINVSGVLGLIYAILMAVVFRSLIQQMNHDPLAPSNIFFYVISGIIGAAAALNLEFLLFLRFGLVYFCSIPIAYLILPLYAIANMDDSSWGTRVNKDAEVAEVNNNQTTCGMYCLHEAANATTLVRCGCCQPPPIALLTPQPPPATAAANAAQAPAATQAQAPAQAQAQTSTISQPVSQSNVTMRQSRFGSVITPDADIEDRDEYYIDTSTWTNGSTLFGIDDPKKLLEEREKDLLKVRGTSLAILAMLNISWILIQVTVNSRNGLNIRFINTNPYSALFIGLYGILSCLQFLSCVLSVSDGLVERLAGMLASSKPSDAEVYEVRQVQQPRYRRVNERTALLADSQA
jgi:cellulose synthase/poly-beta-1,6-N-acetylglucosamine synthase-like glycosyltransferase